MTDEFLVEETVSNSEALVITYRFIIEDSSLTAGARGLLLWLLSRPEDWTIRLTNLIKEFPEDNRNRIRGYLKELDEKNYLIRRTVSEGKGKIRNQTLLNKEIFRDAIFSTSKIFDIEKTSPLIISKPKGLDSSKSDHTTSTVNNDVNNNDQTPAPVLFAIDGEEVALETLVNQPVNYDYLFDKLGNRQVKQIWAVLTDYFCDKAELRKPGSEANKLWHQWWLFVYNRFKPPILKQEKDKFVMEWEYDEEIIEKCQRVIDEAIKLHEGLSIATPESLRIRWIPAIKTVKNVTVLTKMPKGGYQ